MCVYFVKIQGLEDMQLWLYNMGTLKTYSQLDMENIFRANVGGIAQSNGHRFPSQSASYVGFGVYMYTKYIGMMIQCLYI